MTDIKDILTGLFEEIERVKKKRPSADSCKNSVIQFTVGYKFAL